MAAITEYDYTALSPVEKIQWLQAVAGMDLTRDQLAVAITLANMANSQTGKAWPSYQGIADRAGISRRQNAYRAIQGLIKKKIIILKSQGNRADSNTYMLNAAIVDKSLIAVDKTEGCNQERLQGVISSDYRVSSPVITGCNHQRLQNPITNQLKESVIQSERETADQEIAKAIERANEYQEFWKAAGKGNYYQVSEVEAELDRLTGEGHQLEAIIAGLERWQAYTAAKGSKKVLSILKWLQGKRFNDPWAIPNNVQPIRRRKLL